MMMGSSGGVIGIGVLLLVLLLVGGLVIGGNWLARRNWGTGVERPRERDEEVLEILRERYARGEITKEVYDSMRKHLGR
jgi:uncharacterized membrane protein